LASFVRGSRPARLRGFLAAVTAAVAVLCGSVLTGSDAAPAASRSVGGNDYLAGSQVSSVASGRYSIMQVTLDSGRNVDARWNPCQSVITYRVNLSGLPRSKRAAMLRTVRASFKRLHAATGMTYRYRGTTGFVPRQQNLAEQPAEIVVAVVPRRRTDLPLTARSLGYGGVLWSTWYGPAGEGAAIMRGYVVLEASAMRTLRGGWGGGTRRTNVILHELAHASGLDHVNSPRQQMYPTLTASAPNGYSRGDLAGLAAVGERAGCIEVPDDVSLPDLD